MIEINYRISLNAPSDVSAEPEWRRWLLPDAVVRFGLDAVVRGRMIKGPLSKAEYPGFGLAICCQGNIGVARTTAFGA